MSKPFLFLVLAAWTVRGDLNDAPPRGQLIAVARASSGETSVTGAAGAVPGSSTVTCITLDTGHYATVKASSSGSFTSPQLYAPAGTSVLVKVDPLGHPFDPHAQGLIGLAGTIVRVPDPEPRDGVLWFGGANLTPGPFPIAWRFEGSFVHNEGLSLVVRGTVILDSPAVDGAGVMRVSPRLSLERLTQADGSPAFAQATFSSVILTPTGFPIERVPANYATSIHGATATFQKTAPGRAEASIEVTLPLPSPASHGYYRPVLMAMFEGIPQENPPSRPMMADIKTVDRASRIAGKSIGASSVYAPVVRIGNPAPPRMIWMLLANHPSEGTRGARAIEDRNVFGFAPRVAMQSDTLVLPRTDSRSGQTIRYRIEPFAPLVSLGDRELPSPPLVPLRFPSGALRAKITHPDGRVVETAALPFVQSRSINAVTISGRPLETGGGYPNDPYQLSTMDPSFDLSFESDGRYVIRLDGWVEDAWGTRWSGSGTYEVMVANALVLDTAVLPGTPFEAGDVFHPALQVVPGVAADVEMRVQLLVDSDPAQKLEYVSKGRANRFGRFRADGIPLPSRGEYRVDALATWRDPAGHLWAGARTWGSAVAPRDAALVAHGNRGIDDMPRPRPIWFRRTTPTGSGHVHVPFLCGDILWATDDDAAIPHITYEDPQRKLASLVTRPGHPGWANRYEEGATPPFLMTSTGADAHFDPDAIDVWAYAYRSVQRPLVRVREIVGEESGIAGYYWRFNSAYGGQRGNGVDGDLPNDFKFQYGAIVVRGEAVGEPQYAVYGSLFVLVPEQDLFGGSRVFPPFRGNGGGTDGGPLFTLKGKEIDLFFHLTGVRPGTILHRGQSASFAGYSAPTLPSRIEIVVTAPSGATRTIRGQANKIGYFYDPSQDFTVGESGVWRAKVKIVFDGRTSAGPVTDPFPRGDVLGSREGELYFYVVDSNAAELDLAAMPQFVRPADGPITFTAKPPSGLSNVQLAYTTTMPGFILEEKTQTSMNVVYDATKLAKDFPNLDLHDADGYAGVDTITISFLLSGTDAQGKRQHFARQLVLQGEELQMPAQPPPLPRRRAVR